MDLTGDETQELRSAAEDLAVSPTMMARVWKSPSLNRWHWVFSPEGAPQVNPYSGIAPTEAQAWKDIVLSAEHYILVYGPEIEQ